MEENMSLLSEAMENCIMLDKRTSSDGGYGGYSKGVTYLQKDETVYIVVGGQGSFGKSNNISGG